MICEPKVQFNPHKDHFIELGFDKYEIVEASGFSGGIWLLWKSSSVSVTPIDRNLQSITANICYGGNHPWLLTVLYASPSRQVRHSLWSYLDTIRALHQSPWFIVGDFNEVLSGEDINGGSMRGGAVGFKKWVNRSVVIDMGYQGAPFTWTNNTIKERLDRCFCDSDWRLRFPEAKVIHLA